MGGCRESRRLGRAGRAEEARDPPTRVEGGAGGRRDRGADARVVRGGVAAPARAARRGVRERHEEGQAAHLPGGRTRSGRSGRRSRRCGVAGSSGSLGSPRRRSDVARPDEARAVEQSVRVDASRAAVWRCLTRNDLLSTWLEAGATIEPRVGGAVRIDFARYRTVVVGEVIELVPERAIAFTWGAIGGSHGPTLPPGSTKVRITLEDAAGGTQVTLRHEGFTTEK